MIKTRYLLFLLAHLSLSSTLLAQQSRGPISEQEASPPRPQSLRQVTVLGDDQDLRSIPGSAHRVDKQQIERHQATDPLRVLREVPGVYTQEEDGFGLRPNIGMRGTGLSRSSKITIMEDGILAAPSPYSSPAAYFFPPMSRMDAVEVRMGSSAIRFGPNTQGGAINMISTPLRKGTHFDFDLSNGQRSAGRTLLRINSGGEHVGVLVESLSFNDNGFKVLDNNGPTGFRVSDHLIKVRVNTDPTKDFYQEFNVKVHQFNENSDETYLGLTNEDFAATPLRRYAASQKDNILAMRRMGVFRHFIDLGKGIDLNTAYYTGSYQRNWYKLDQMSLEGSHIRMGSLLDNPSAQPEAFDILRGLSDSPEQALLVKANNRTHGSQGLTSTLNLDIDGGPIQHKVEIGARLHSDFEDRFQHVDRYQMISGTMVLNQAGTPGTGNGNNQLQSAEALAVHIHDTMEWQNFQLSMGLRSENISYSRLNYGGEDPERSQDPTELKNQISAVMPGAGLSYKFSDDWQTFAGVHRGFGPPGPSMNEDTLPESSLNTEIGLRQQSTWVHSTLVYFRNDYQNLLGADTAATGGDGTGNMYNGGKALIQGVEASFRTDLVSLAGQGIHLPIALNYTFTDARFGSSFETSFGDWAPSVTQGDLLPLIPTQQLALSLGIEKKDLASIFLSGHYRDAMRTQAGQESLNDFNHVPGYTVFDLSGRYSLYKDAWLTIDVRNAFDQRFAVARSPYGPRPGLPRTVLAGLKFTM